MKLDLKSTSERIITRFDYEILSPQKRNVVQKCTGEIKDRLRRTAQDVWEVAISSCAKFVLSPKASYTLIKL